MVNKPTPASTQTPDDWHLREIHAFMQAQLSLIKNAKREDVDQVILVKLLTLVASHRFTKLFSFNPRVSAAGL